MTHQRHDAVYSGRIRTDISASPNPSCRRFDAGHWLWRGQEAAAAAVYWSSTIRRANSNALAS
jgi:hypothetical protein